jgi:hypothetical protein
VRLKKSRSRRCSPGHPVFEHVDDVFDFAIDRSFGLDLAQYKFVLQSFNQIGWSSFPPYDFFFFRFFARLFISAERSSGARRAQ